MWSLQRYGATLKMCYPGIIVSNSHGNKSKYVDTLTLFKTFNQKVNDPKWPLDDL